MLNIDSISIKSNNDKKVYMDINNVYSNLTTIYEELDDKYGKYSPVIVEFFKYLAINYQINATFKFRLRTPYFETDNDTLINNPTEASVAILEIRTFLENLEYIYNNINDILIMINWIINDEIKNIRNNYNKVLSDIKSAVSNVLKTYGLRFENINTVIYATSGTFEIKKLYLGSTKIELSYAEKFKSINNIDTFKRAIFKDVYEAMADTTGLNHYEYWYVKYQQYLKYREIDNIIVNKLYKGKFSEEAIFVYSNALRRLYNIKIDLNNIDKHKYTYIDFSDTCKEKILLFDVDLDNDKINYCLSKYTSVRKYFDANGISVELDCSLVHGETANKAAKTNEENKKGLPKQEAPSRIHSNKVFDIYLDDLKDEVRKEYLKQAELDEDDVTGIDWPITTIIL